MDSQLLDNMFYGFLQNQLREEDMNVNGENQPQVFKFLFNPKALGYSVIASWTIVLHGKKMDNAMDFVSIDGGLTNGIEIGMVTENMGFEPYLFPIKNNLDFHIVSGRSTTIDFPNTKKEAVVFRIIDNTPLSITSRKYLGVYVKIQDDLTSLNYVKSYIKGGYTKIGGV